MNSLQKHVAIVAVIMSLCFMQEVKAWVPCPPCYVPDGYGGCSYMCDPVCEKCSGGSCAPKCGSSNCCADGSCCSSDCCGNTCCPSGKVCCNGHCCSVGLICCGETCCDPDTEVCCSDGCRPKCEEVDSETTCSSENDIPCPGCVGIFGNCLSNDARFYTNETIYNCSGGCPGECDDEDPPPPCVDFYFCENYIHYTFAECTNGSETGPVPLDCYDAGMPWGCTRCQQGGYWRTLPVVSRRCQ